MSTLQELPKEIEALTTRVAGLAVEISELRTEMHGEFSAIRGEMASEFTGVRADMAAQSASLRAIATRLDETNRHMQVLHEEVLSRLAAP